MGAKALGEYSPDYAVHPGRTLAETMAELEISQADLARRTGFSEKHVSEVANQTAGISPDFALALERATGVPARLWNNLERDYRESLARIRDRERLAVHVEWLDSLPYKELARRGWVEQRDHPVDQLISVLRFFGVASPEQWQAKWGEMQIAFRRSPAYQATPGALSAWIRRGETLASAIACRPYDEGSFRRTLAEIRGLTRSQPEEFCPTLTGLCASVGVAVTFVPQLPKTRVCGATMWLSSNKALIQLSLRYHSDDHLWFAFYHEAAHILTQGKRDILLEDERARSDSSEQEADRLAADLLIPPIPFAIFVDAGLFDSASVAAFATEIGVAPGIVVGRLQHEGRVKWRSNLNALKVRLGWAPGICDRSIEE